MVHLCPCLQVLLLWWRVQYFARAFQNTRNTFLNTLVAVTKDVWPFLILLLLTLWGFAGALSVVAARCYVLHSSRCCPCI